MTLPVSGAAPLAFALALLAGGAEADVAKAMRLARAGDFAASATVRCAQEVGEPFGDCRARVARDDGAAAVVVTFPNGFARTLSFAGGDFLRGNATMSGVGTDTDWRLDGGIYHVRVDDQRFEIPEALVLGD